MSLIKEKAGFLCTQAFGCGRQWLHFQGMSRDAHSCPLSLHYSGLTVRKLRRERERYCWFSGSPGVFEKQYSYNKGQKPSLGLAKGEFIDAVVSGFRDKCIQSLALLRLSSISVSAALSMSSTFSQTRFLYQAGTVVAETSRAHEFFVIREEALSSLPLKFKIPGWSIDLSHLGLTLTFCGQRKRIHDWQLEAAPQGWRKRRRASPNLFLEEKEFWI